MLRPCSNLGKVTECLVPQLLQIGVALKQLVSKLKQGNILKEWKAREYFVRPAQQRVLDAKETRRRLAKKRFKATMAAISARQAR